MSKENQALQRMEPVGDMEVATPQPSLSLAAITDKIMSGELNKEKLDMVERLVSIDAERKFAAAFVALQKEMPKIKATKPIPDKHGNIKFRYAPFESIMREVQPYLQKHGFTVSFSMRFENTRVIQTCTLRHEGGHKQSNDFAARVGQGPPGSNECQADGAASTYAKRFALCDALNIVVEQMDTDGRAEGAYITPEQAQELESRIQLIHGDVKAFLALAEADSFETISAAKYNILDNLLRQKERKAK